MVGVYGSGYLATQIITQLATVNCSVSSLSRTEKVNDSISVVIDASFPRNYSNYKVFKNYQKLLASRLDDSRRVNAKYIYLGSYSSIGLPKSRYGSAKQKAEMMVLASNHTVLRLGLVIDTNLPGGRYFELQEVMRKIPISLSVPQDWCPIKITYLSDVLANIYAKVKQKDLITNGVHEVLGTLDTNLNFILDMYPSRLFKIQVPSLLMSLFAFLAHIFPIGKLDNLNSIMYKEKNHESI